MGEESAEGVLLRKIEGANLADILLRAGVMKQPISRPLTGSSPPGNLPLAIPPP